MTYRRPALLGALALAAALVAPTALPVSAPAAADDAVPTAADGAAAACTATVTSSTVRWGVRQSYRSYMGMGFNNGWALSDGAAFEGEPAGEDGVFVLPGTQATAPGDGSADVETTGSLFFSGHRSAATGLLALETTLSGLRAHVAADGSGSLTVDYHSKQYTAAQDGDAPFVDADDATIVTFTGATGLALDATESSTTGTYTKTATATSTVLGAAGVTALDGGMGAYTQGGEADNPTVTLTYTVSCPEPAAQPAGTASPEPEVLDPAGTGAATPVATADPSATATATSSPAPATAAPSTPAPQGCATTVTGTDLRWGVKQSYRRYITNRAMNDGWTLGGGATFTGNEAGADGAFVLPVDTTGAAVGTDGTARVPTHGTLRFTGHAGLLDSSLSDLTVIRRADGTADLVGDFSALAEDLSGTIHTGDDVTLATLTGLAAVPTPTTPGESTYTSTAGVALATGGTQAFGEGSYAVGTEMDDLTLTLRLSTTCGAGVTGRGTVSTATHGTVSSHGGGMSADPSIRDGATTPQGAATQGGDGDGAAAQAAPAVTCKVTGHGVSAGSLSWGLKSSFRSYIAGGIAKGSVSTSGGAGSDGSTYTFAAAGGSASAADSTADVYLAGAVNFTGHKGVLNLTIADPVVHITSPGSGYLTMTVSSTDMKGAPVPVGTIRFADLTFSSVSVTDTALSAQTSSVTLTAEGATAFAGFYSAGQALDNLSLSATLTDKETCYDANGRPVSGHLASTGADGVLPLASLSALLLGLGTALVARRHA